MHSSSTRRKAAFVPWVAALVLGASAHAGLLIHELRSSAHTQSVELHIDVPEPRARTQVIPRCRHVERRTWTEVELEPAESDFDLWIHQTGRHSYSVDRRVLDQLELAALEADAVARLGAVFGALKLDTPVELRNIEAGTPLHLLGLRTGDRLLAIATDQGGEEALLSLDRRGRRVLLRYTLV